MKRPTCEPSPVTISSIVFNRLRIITGNDDQPDTLLQAVLNKRLQLGPISQRRVEENDRRLGKRFHGHKMP